MLIGNEAKKLYDEAQDMLTEIIRNESLEARGIVGFYPANSIGDDIIIYESDDRTKSNAVLHGLRQQAEIESQTSYQCISDFIAPRSSGRNDYIGMFAVSTGFGCEEICSR